MCSVLLLAVCGLGPIAASGAPAKLSMDVAVTQGRVDGGATTLKLNEGDTVTLNVTSDVADELHVHGLDLHLQIVPGKTSTLDIVANRTGRFTVELHRSRIAMGVLEVYPR
jgi:FtsP/CotA-like multicopper oxidase with cupredoxin domain